MGTSLEDRPRYTPTTCFETFPFPEGLTPADTAHQRTETLDGGAIIPTGLSEQNQAVARIETAQAATKNVAISSASEAQARAGVGEAQGSGPILEPQVHEATASAPCPPPNPPALAPGARSAATPDGAARKVAIAIATAAKLYNQRPAWLDAAHKALDMAVAQVYGWADYTAAMPDDEILKRLLALNLERSNSHRAIDTKK